MESDQEMRDRNSYFTSAPFKFIVEGQPFFAHSGLISHVSEPLDRLINLEMKEKQQGYAVLKDVTAATFDPFLEWASKGYYTPPPPSIDPESEVVAEDHSRRKSKEQVPEEAESHAAEAGTNADFGFGGEPVADRVMYPPSAEADNDWTFGSGFKKTKKDIKKESTTRRRENMREAFHSRQPAVRRGQINISPPRKNLNKSENYTEIFLCHARLYVFADLQDIQKLKSLALDELHALLAIFDLYQERTGDVVSLLRYAYANSGEHACQQRA